MNRSAFVAGAVACCMAIPVSATATAPLPPTSAMTTEQLGQVRDQYLGISCPAARYGKTVLATFKKTWGKRKSVPFGTRQPKAMRVKYRKYAVVLDRRGNRLSAASWPQDLQPLINEVILTSRTAADYFASRDTPRVSRSWRDSYYNSTEASQTIRALLLVPEGDVCG